MYEIDFHADDYASSMNNSQRIISLARAGRIDSFSVITNMRCFDACMNVLRENWDSFPKKPLLSVHLNLIDGYWLSSSESGSLIQNSWGRIFLQSLFPGEKRACLLRSYSAEIEAQLRTFLNHTEGMTDGKGEPIALRIDSHVHTHMIPLVFQALAEALDRTGLRSRVSFIRCSTEPLAMFLFTPGVAGTVPPVNILKNLMLRLLSCSIRKKLDRMKINTGRIFGVALTGEMDLKRVRLLLPKMKRYAQKKDAYLEVLAHPGRATESELVPEFGPDDRKAFLSPKRDEEYQMMMDIER